MKKIVLFLLKIYQLSISPAVVSLTGHACRFHPTCSTYASEAIDRFGVIKGGRLAIIRIGKCHPFYHGSPLDPLPKKA